MILDVLELVVGEGPLLVEDLLPNADLADVMEPARGPDQFDLLFVEPHFGRHRGGQVGHPGGVASEIGILGFQGVDERLERRDRDPLQVGAFHPEFGRPDRHFFLEPVVDLLALDHRVPTPEGALDGPQQVGQVDRLGEVVHGPPLHAEGGAGRVVDGREHQDGGVRFDLEDPGHQIDAVGVGHPDVEEHAGDLLALEDVDRLGAVAGGGDFEVLLREEPLEGAADRLLIVDDEDGDRPLRRAVELVRRGGLIHGDDPLGRLKCLNLRRLSPPGKGAARVQPMNSTATRCGMIPAS